MKLNRRAPLACAVGAAMLVAVAGCSQTAAPAGSGPTSVTPSTSTSARQAATSSTVPHVPASPTAAPKRVDVTITPDGDTTVRLGGPPMRFSVTLVNEGPDLPRVGLVVSLGHCTCGRPGASMMAAGSMRMLDPQSNEWVEVPYVREGTGMDYITANLVPPFALMHGQTAAYQLEMALDADQDGITNGETAIDVTLTNPDDPMEGDRLGSAFYHPITVET